MKEAKKYKCITKEDFESVGFKLTTINSEDVYANEDLVALNLETPVYIKHEEEDLYKIYSSSNNYFVARLTHINNLKSLLKFFTKKKNQLNIQQIKRCISFMLYYQTPKKGAITMKKVLEEIEFLKSGKGGTSKNIDDFLSEERFREYDNKAEEIFNKKFKKI